MTYSIIIVDNHNIVREGFSSLFQNNEKYKIAATFDMGKPCLEYLSNNKNIDFVLMDYSFPDISGIELLNAIKKISPATKLVFLTESVKKENIVNAYDHKVDGYISKTISFSRLIESLDLISTGEHYFEPDVLPLLNKELLIRDTKDELLSKLTNREKQILINVANGMSNKEIASECNISERTVKNHLSNIFQKIEVADRTQAAVFAIKTNLIQL